MEVELEKYYSNLNDMFVSEGWSSFKEDLQVQYDSMRDNSPTDCDTNDKWQYRRGQLEVLTYILGFDNLMKDAYDELASRTTSE